MAVLVTAGLFGVAPLAAAQAGAVARAQRAVQIVSGGNRIGVSIQDLENADAKALKGATSGVVIQDVSRDSPAEKAGMQKGDVIVEFDGERVRSVRQLTRLVQETPAGRSVPVTVVRDGQRTNLAVTPTEGRGALGRFDFDDFDDLRLRAVPRAPAAPSPPTPPNVWRFDDLLGRSTRLGITVDSLSPQLAEYFGTKSGVLVSAVRDNSVGAKAGLKAGDVITSLNGSSIDDPADLRRRLLDLRDGDQFTIEVMRDRKPVTLKGQIERDDRGRSSHSII